MSIFCSPNISKWQLGSIITQQGRTSEKTFDAVPVVEQHTISLHPTLFWRLASFLAVLAQLLFVAA